MSANGTASGGTFIQAYDACKAYFEPLLAARNEEIGMGGLSRKVPRDWHRCKPRGGSMRDRTDQSISTSRKSARTLPGMASGRVSHA